MKMRAWVHPSSSTASQSRRALQKCPAASASGEDVAPVQAEDATVVDSDVDAQMRKVPDREEELSYAYITPQRF